jgi:hypothetical protein
MAFVHRRSETALTVAGARVRLVAASTTVDVGRRHLRIRLAHAGPREVEVERENGRVEVVRTRDLDLLLRTAIVAIGAVATRRLRNRRSRS